MGIAGEFSGFNNGLNQSLLYRTDSTYHVLITSKGEYPTTAAIYLHAASGYPHGLAAREDAFPTGAELPAVLQMESTFRHSPPIGTAISYANGRRVVVRKISGFDCLTLE